MSLEELIAVGLETALNEADVVGLLLSPQSDALDLLLHVLALPERGPIDPDGRRVLRLLSPGRVQVLLRSDTTATDGYGPALPLADLDAVESFFDGLSWGGSIYGWKFFDDRSLTKDWPMTPSLSLDLRTSPAAHTFYWFNERGRRTGDETEAFCIEGTVTFDGLTVLRADASELPLNEFIADGRRWGDAMYERDERLSSEAQQQAQRHTPKWRTWAGGGTSVSGPLP